MATHHMPVPDRSFKYVCGLILGAAAVISALLLVQPEHRAQALSSERGPLEIASVLLLGAAFICGIFAAWRKASLFWVSVSALLLWMVLRELDFQKLFTPRSIESIGFYSNPKTPFYMKAAAIASLAPFGIAGLHILKSSLRAARTPGWLFGWRYPLASAGILVVAASVSEKLLSKRFQAVEESAEMAFAGLISMLVVHFAFRAGDPAGNHPEAKSPLIRTE
jgi:lysylphosphatidylglycerol synthetase-like protein (DUF2156 family)